MSARPPERAGGNSREARAWNQLLDYVASLTPVIAPHGLTSRTTRGTSVKPKPGTGGGTGTADDNLTWL